MSEPSCILIAEDSRADRLLLSTLIARQGHRVICAATGLEAVNLFQRERPQLVLMDALMPVMDGLEAARRIKRLAGDELVPVIFLTALTDHDSLVRCLEVGGDDFITKPYNPVVLNARIQALLRLRRLQDTVLRQRDLISLHNRQLLDEQRAAKAIFDKVAHAGCLSLPCIRYRQSPRALFNGDLLLAARAPADNIFVLLGDFTGHGLPAAIGAMPVAETFYGMTAKGYSSADILRELNAKLRFILPVEMFCCATLVDISRAEGVIRVWNGGLPDGYLLRADGSARLALESTHLPLGVLQPERFDDHFETLQLNVGDRLLLLSDGVLESNGPEGEMFGEQRLLDVLDANRDPARLFDEVEQALQAFGGQDLDDVSLVQIVLGDDLQANTPGAVATLTQGFAPADWTARFEWHADSLRSHNPLPQLLQQLLQVAPLRSRAATVFTVLSELYCNALEHGVLGLDSSLKCSADGFATYYRLRESRLQALVCGFIRLDIEVRGEPHGGYLRVLIEDSGPGFDVAGVLADQHGIDSLSGRGLGLVRRLADRFEWRGGGRGLCVEFRWSGDA